MDSRTIFVSSSTVPSIAPQHSLGYVWRACATMAAHGSDSIRIIELVVPEVFAEVFLGAVAEHRDDRAGFAPRHQVARDQGRSVDIAAGRNPDQQSLFLGQPPDHL